ncbi:hypothetical protein JVW19_21925, partial [Vibrio cholerae O1]|nr:hypothetical protein [Vibrio cholerae O1]
EILIEHCQVTKETEKDLVVTIDTAFDNEATIKIPARCVDKLENGQYKIFIKRATAFRILIKKVRQTIKSWLGQPLLKIYK